MDSTGYGQVGGFHDSIEGALTDTGCRLAVKHLQLVLQLGQAVLSGMCAGVGQGLGSGAYRRADRGASPRPAHIAPGPRAAGLPDAWCPACWGGRGHGLVSHRRAARAAHALPAVPAVHVEVGHRPGGLVVERRQVAGAGQPAQLGPRGRADNSPQRYASRPGDASASARAEGVPAAGGVRARRGRIRSVLNRRAGDGECAGHRCLPATAVIVLLGLTAGATVIIGRTGAPPRLVSRRWERLGPLRSSRLRHLLVTGTLVNLALSGTEVALTGYLRQHHALWASGPLLAGLTLGPSLATIFGLASRAAPDGSGTEIQSWLNSAMNSGAAAGAALAGAMAGNPSLALGLRAATAVIAALSVIKR